MRKNTLAFGFLILLVLFSSVGVRDVSGSAPEPEPEPKEAWEAAPASTYSNMSVSLNTPTHQVIKFNIGGDNIRTEKPAQEVSEIPHLVLKRNGVLTPGYERTLEIEAHNVPVYAPGWSGHEYRLQRV